MWLFALHWLPKLAEMPPEAYSPIHEQINDLWLIPVQHAIEKHLNTTLPE
jgi:hypothetical protein